MSKRLVKIKSAQASLFGAGLVIRAVIPVVLTWIVAGCSGWKVTTASSDLLPGYTVRTLALIPFTAMTTPQMRDQGDFFFSTPQSIRQQDMSVAVASDVEPKPRQVAVVPDYAAERVTQLFWKRLQSRGGVRLIPPSEAAQVLTSVVSETTSSKTRPEVAAAAVARKLNADAVMIGLVSMYQERVGSRLGANPAASVGFEVKVVAADGRVLWEGNYYERQRPLTEDVLGFVQRFGMFVTADELAEYGVDALLKEFPF
ncbi:MAG: hypothetical protein NNA20_09300 [Nitrospira sp.]|nr:hypothetical protein [Nitrospira sp.]MCP9442777.1 hypothetical protein [Nitrospira sp.]